MEKFYVKKGFMLPAPPDGTGLEVKETPEGAEPSELELTASQRESLIGDGSIVPVENTAPAADKTGDEKINPENNGDKKEGGENAPAEEAPKP